MKDITPLFQNLASIANIIHDNAIIGCFSNEYEKKIRLDSCRFSIAQLVKNLKDFDEKNQGEHNG